MLESKCRISGVAPAMVEYMHTRLNAGICTSVGSVSRNGWNDFQLGAREVIIASAGISLRPARFPTCKRPHRLADSAVGGCLGVYIIGRSRIRACVRDL